MQTRKDTSRDSAIRTVLIYFLGIFLLIGAILTGTISVLYNLETENYLERIELEMRHSLRLQLEIIRKSLDTVVSDLLFLSKQNELLDLLDTSDASYREQIAQEYLQFSRKKTLYDQIRFLDETGMEIVRVNYNGGAVQIVDGSRLQPKGNRYYFKDTYALADEYIFVSPFDLNIENGEIEIPHKPMIRFGIPVYDRQGEKRGVIILNYLGANIVARMKEIAGLLPGDVMLVNADGYWLCSPNPADDWGFMIQGREDRQFQAVYPQVWREISTSATGQIHNEKGLFTADTIYPVSEGMKTSTGSSEAHGDSGRSFDSGEYHWKIVSHIPSDALHEETRGLLANLFFLAVTLFLISSIPSWLIAQAIVRRKFHQIELFHSANYDKLTELPNRSLFLDRLDQILRESERYERTFALLFIDLDGFKAVNDTYGHDAGDKLLIQTAQRLIDCTRRSDTVARLGGDEFTVIVSGVKMPDDVEIVAQHILTALSTTFSIKSQDVSLGGSIGISIFPKHGKNADTMLKNADSAMYQAKMSGKNGYRLST